MRNALRAAFALTIVLEAIAPFVFRGMASDFTWLGLIVTALFAWGMTEIFRLSSLITWTVFFATILDGASAIFELYSRIEPWDLLIHTLGGFIIAAGTIEIVSKAMKNGHLIVRKPKIFMALIAYLSTATVGFLYEFCEYLVDKFQYGYPKSLVSAYDSIEDQLLNLAGATVILCIYFLKTRRRG